MQIPEADEVSVTEYAVQAELPDGRAISIPLAWYSRVVHAVQAERNSWDLIGKGQGIRRIWTKTLVSKDSSRVARQEKANALSNGGSKQNWRVVVCCSTT
jgi:hypothetical protein